MSKEVVFNSKSPSETIRIGKTIGSSLQAGDVVALMGELGAGKTQFIKGLAQGVGVGKSVYVSSPSFTLINEYNGGIPFYHIDLYRLEEEKEAEELGLEEYFHGEGITAIEWADRIPSLLPGEILRVNIHYTGKQTRSIELVAKGKRYEELLKEFGMQNSLIRVCL
ncbi:MAG: tRNA (adenosine(37)-N6)-threonylcarbamoyltransferase complex ATPase subunit type 1 TsaE [Syntrophaceae bacterium]|nr:tRNA (adenosine(37)-N6)-threonylcarbamoyltransferase complex ATPase subunit type 1 TsaE [Syntrophaceae bacterium]